MGNGLTTEEEKTIAAVFAQVPAIERAVLFGSRAMGLARGNSDVDIALYGEKLGLPDVLHTASLLEETPLPYHFDLISHASITSPELLEHIRQYGKEMYRKESDPQEKCLERSIAGNFQEYELSDLCYYADGRAVVSDLDLDTYISTENMIPNKGGITRSAGLPAVNQTQAYQVNDVLVSNIRPYFRKIWFADRDGGCSNDVLVLRAKETCNPKFLYYLLSENAFFDYATATGKGTKMPRGDKKAIMRYSVPDMPLKYQVEIAATLCSLDDKIENNRKVNQCLEQMAQAIFKSWFVDFEPWGGVMPNDWREGTFTEVISTTLGGDWGKDALSGNNTQEVYCIRGADIPDVNVGNKGKMPIRFILPKNYSAKRLGVGDIVIEISGGSPTQSTGRCALITQSLLDRYDRGMVCTNFCRAVKPFKGYSSFVYFYWKYLYDQNVMFSYENGTTGIKNLDISSFLEKELVILPPADVVSQFAEAVGTFINTIYANGLENEVLATTRDALLPRLMSGELSVGDVEAS